MIRHIVSWNYKDGLTEDEKKACAKLMQISLIGIQDAIGAELSVAVIFSNLFDSSNRDLVLDSLFTSREALEAYQVHPKHQELVGMVKDLLQDRVCVDYDMADGYVPL